MSLIPMCHAGPETGHRHVPLSSHAPCVRVSVRCDEFLYGTKKRPAQRAARGASRGPAVNRPPARASRRLPARAGFQPPGAANGHALRPPGRLSCR